MKGKSHGYTPPLLIRQNNCGFNTDLDPKEEGDLLFARTLCYLNKRLAREPGNLLLERIHKAAASFTEDERNLSREFFLIFPKNCVLKKIYIYIFIKIK